MGRLIQPFRALRPAPGRAADVAAPPYDVLSTAEARERARGRPWSFLHVSKPEIDLPEDTDPHAPEVYARGAANFRRLLDEGVLLRDASPAYYVYRLHMGEHVQTGLGLTGSVAAYDANRIRRHEFTRPDKEDDRVRQISALGAQTGPVLLAWRSDARLAALLDEAAGTATPAADVVADDGVRHTLWTITRQDRIAEISAIVNAMPALYIADGHHRSAAASRVAAAHGASEAAAAGWFLCVGFPHDEMRILDYNRVVSGLNGHDPDSLLARVGERFGVRPAAGPVHPDRPGRFGLRLAGQWYALEIHPSLIPDDPVGRLDVSLLQDQLLSPLLGIGDPRRDARIDFIGGIRGLGELERRVDGREAAAFSLHPTRMDDLMAVADAGEVMPPKSTWFEPKLADGLLSHVLDDPDG